MDDRTNLDDIPTICAYTADDAVAAGTLVDLASAPAHKDILPIKSITSMDSYLQNYGAILGRKAIHALAPLHLPERDPLPDFEDLLRDPFPAQKHVIAAAVKMLDTVRNGFIVGEMGTGKTLLGMVATHKHAQRSRNQGGSNGRYRAIVLCPDHLIGKWCREIGETIDGAFVIRFGPQGGEEKPAMGMRRKPGEEKPDAAARRTLRDVVALLDKGGARRNPHYGGKRWAKPEGAEWFVLGRNQAKWLSDWSGMADKVNGFNAISGALTRIATSAMIGRDEDGTPIGPTIHQLPPARPVTIKVNAVSSKMLPIDRVAVTDENERPMFDRLGRIVMKNVVARVHYCPRCGQVVKDKKGTPVGEKDLQKAGAGSSQKVCKGTYLQMLASGPDCKSHGLDRISPVPGEWATVAAKAGTEVTHGGYRWVVTECKEPLFNYTARPYRWSPARIIQKKLKRMFKYLVIDEVHEQKSDESGQSMACSKLIGAVDHVIALTGTIIGGYAHHLYPLLMRISPKSLKDEGFEWGKDLAFSEAYGRIDRIVTTKEADEGGPSVRGNARSMRRAKSGSRTERKAIRPGVMPTMFGRHMIGSAMFITLEELADELPDLFEYVGGPVTAPPTDADDLARWEKQKDGWFETACEMEPAQKAEYQRVAAILEFANKELLRKGCMKLLGTMLWTCLDYPDKPFGWGHDKDVIKELRAAHKKTGDADEAVEKLKKTHTVGFWDKPGVRTVDNFVGVVTPADCPEEVIYPKEQALIDCCLKQNKDGRQAWVYVQMSGKRNVQPRIAKLLEAVGLKVGVLRADDVEPIDREDWIAANGRDYDVMISHPQLVSTGLDLFSKKQGGHNYSTLIFYETGYNLFTMRQAARRAWRIGQPNDCRVYYFYYKDTMQHKAMSLMSRKMAAAQALEGEFSEDGLAAMAGEDNLQMALAKNLSERIDDADMQRGWGKIKSGAKKKVKRPTAAVAERTPKGGPESPLDNLPIELQLVATTLIEAQGKPVPAAALAEFSQLHADLAALDAGFDALTTNEEFAHHEADETEEGDKDEDAEECLIADAPIVEPEPVAEPESEFDDTFNEEYDPETDPDFAPGGKFELTPQILARMFTNMQSHGLQI